MRKSLRYSAEGWTVTCPAAGGKRFVGAVIDGVLNRAFFLKYRDALAYRRRCLMERQRGRLGPGTYAIVRATLTLTADGGSPAPTDQEQGGLRVDDGQRGLVIGARVRFNDDERWPTLGTVRKVSPAGYVIVDWDRSYDADSHLSPAGAAKLLTVVTGDDALRRHDWEGYIGRTMREATVTQVVHGEAVTRCERCQVVQTDENEMAPCRVPLPPAPSPEKAR
jgi:hypothetical protein